MPACPPGVLSPSRKEGVTPFLQCARAGNCAFMMSPSQFEHVAVAVACCLDRRHLRTFVLGPEMHYIETSSRGGRERERVVIGDPKSRPLRHNRGGRAGLAPAGYA